MNKSSVVKNEKYVVDIIDNGFEGEGIAKIDGLTVFVPGSIKGEKCEILIVKVLASHAYGKIVNIIEKSENRKESDCATYKRCGGCSLRHMTYESTLKLKRQVVQNLVNKGLKKKVEVLETIGMENPYNYRNKAQYPVGLNSEGQPEVGVFAQRTHTIIPIQTCLIQTEISQKIAKTILNFVKEKNIQVYNEENQKGLLRHIVIKVGKYTNQVMCILVVNDSKFNQEQELVKLLCEKYPEIKTIVKNINNKNTNVILGKENINSMFFTSFIFAFSFASSIACGTISIPYTLFTYFDAKIPIVPMPQYKSNNISFLSKFAWFIAVVYNISA